MATMTTRQKDIFSTDCRRCSRLANFLDGIRQEFPGYFASPVPPFGDAQARLLVVGLAPGMHGANRTGRPFTGDYAGVLLYDTLARFGFARGTYAADPSDGLKLVDARITNAVRCLPPLNKPTGVELATCRKFLTASIAEMPKLHAIVALGRIAHNSVVAALGARPKDASFGHGAAHTLGRLRLYDSYHCSRYNTNTGVLSPAMFHAVFAAVRAELDGAQPPRQINREATSP